MFFVCNSFKQFEQIEGKELAHFAQALNQTDMRSFSVKNYSISIYMAYY